MERPKATTEDEASTVTEQDELAARQTVTEPEPGQQEQQEELTEGQESQEETRPETKQEEASKPSRVLVLWDLDNKPAGSLPAATAQNLHSVASQYGEVTAIHAYANRHAFFKMNAVTHRKHKAIREPQSFDDLMQFDGLMGTWDQGVSDGTLWDPEAELGDFVTDQEPEVLRCSVCGQKQKTSKKLSQHMKTLHLRERAKKLNHLASVKSTKKKAKLLERYQPALEKYALASARISNPESGGIKADLQSAGVKVELVSEAAEAADGAIRRHFKRAMGEGVEWVFLVSDDKGFTSILDKAKNRHVKTCVVGSKKSPLRRLATSFKSWQDIYE